MSQSRNSFTYMYKASETPMPYDVCGESMKQLRERVKMIDPAHKVDTKFVRKIPAYSK